VGRAPYAILKHRYRLIRSIQIHGVILFGHDPRASARVPRGERYLMWTEQNFVALHDFEFNEMKVFGTVQQQQIRNALRAAVLYARAYRISAG
jgi:hypothetical protein